MPSGTTTPTEAVHIQAWDDYLSQYHKDDLQALILDYPDTPALVIGFRDIERGRPDIASELLLRPSYHLRLASQAATNVVQGLGPAPGAPTVPRLPVRVRDLPPAAQHPIRGLRSEHLQRFVATDGLVKRATFVQPLARETTWECKFCGNLVGAHVDEDHVTPPVQCDACEKTGPWRHATDMAHFVDLQRLDLQERHERLPAGAQPQNITVLAHEDLAGRVNAGDRIRVSGILIPQQRRQGQLIKPEYAKVLVAVDIEVLEQDVQDLDVTPEDEATIRELVAQGDVMGTLTSRFASSLYGLDDVKASVLLAAAGGWAKQGKDGTRVRGDIHVLLVGDPGVAKSQILVRAKSISPRGMLASGKSTSAAGLTASVTRDDFGQGQWTAEAGVVVLADMGIACIDELDKMTTQDQGAMHQAMEQQVVSVNKAGVSVELKSRCAVIGAANPLAGRFDAYKPIWEQLDMPPALLSRFDLVWVLRDVPGDRDQDLSKFILSSLASMEPFPEDTMRTEDPDSVLIRKWITLAKAHFPRLTPEAEGILQEYYVGMRSAAGESVAITARHLEGLVRIGEAHARLRLSDSVEEEDARYATGLMQKFLEAVGVDPETGAFDIDVITVGATHSQQDRIRLVADAIRALSLDAGFARDEDVIEAVEGNMDRDAAQAAIATLLRNNSGYRKNGAGTIALLRA